MALEVPSASEFHRCQLVELPTDADVDVVGISHSYSLGSHHFLVFRTDLDAIPTDLQGQYDCVNGSEAIMQHTSGVLYGAQSPTGMVRFPPGVGLHASARQVLLMQVHYLNTSSASLNAEATLSFTTVPAGQIATQAGFMTFYDPFIYLPPKSTASSGFRCGISQDITLLIASTHYHQRGTGMKVWFDPDMTTRTDLPLYETHDWQHSQNFEGPKDVAGGSVVRMQCDYVNPDPAEVFQGPNAATSEMCVLGAVYYPKADDSLENCVQMSVTGTGTLACLDLATCVQKCPPGDGPQRTHGGINVGPCWERCVAQGCDSATDRLLPLVSCFSQHCTPTCGEDAAACSACAAAQCAAPYQACAGHVCGN
jgi:hypothetical protein